MNVERDSIGSLVDSLIDGDVGTWREFIRQLDVFGRRWTYGLGWKAVVMAVCVDEKIDRDCEGYEEFERYLKIVYVRDGVSWDE